MTSCTWRSDNIGVSRQCDNAAAAVGDGNEDCDTTESILDDCCGETAPLSAEDVPCVDDMPMRPRRWSLFISIPILLASSSAHMTTGTLHT